MKFLPLTVAALWGLAVEASQQNADVFLVQSTTSPDTATQPRLSREVARHILLQRTSRSRYGSDLRDIPDSIDAETAVEHLARYGKNPMPLFPQQESSEPSQLVVILEGVDAASASRLKDALAESGQQPAFGITDPPSAAANNRLMTLFRNMGIVSETQCDLARAINPFEHSCWTGASSVVKYDIAKSPETIQALVDNLPRLNKFVSARELEAVLVLMPESSRMSKLDHWSAAAAGLSSSRRRSNDAETVITDDTVSIPTKAPVKSQSSRADKKGPKAIPQCFTSLDSCMSRTANCSGHGECTNKYLASDKMACFSCACKATIVHRKDDGGSRGERTIHWGGNMCQKEDISVQFWLLAGFTVTIIGAVTFAIGLLYSVGEETLPGVIGAGVSRAK